MKPFAVMMKDLDVVRRECETEPHLEEILDGHQKPIILLPKKEGGFCFLIIRTKRRFLIAL